MMMWRALRGHGTLALLQALARRSQSAKRPIAKTSADKKPAKPQAADTAGRGETR